MDMQTKTKSIEDFKKKFKEEIDFTTYQEFEKHFYVETYFYTTKIPFNKENFYETILEVISNILKNYLQEVEYYLSIRPSSPQTISDLEVITKENENLTKISYELHILYKKSHKTYLEGKKNEKETLELSKEIYEKVKEFTLYSAKLQEMFIENLKEKLKELGKEELENKKKRFDSSIYH